MSDKIKIYSHVDVSLCSAVVAQLRLYCGTTLERFCNFLIAKSNTQALHRQRARLLVRRALPKIHHRFVQRQHLHAVFDRHVADALDLELARLLVEDFRLAGPTNSRPAIERHLLLEVLESALQHGLLVAHLQRVVVDLERHLPRRQRLQLVAHQFLIRFR